MLLLLASVLHGRDEPPGSSLLTIVRAERDWEEDGVGGRGGRKEEGRGWQQSTKDNADASSLVHLVPNSALHSRKEPAGLLLLCYEGADRDREVEEERGGGGRGEQAGNKFSK